MVDPFLKELNCFLRDLYIRWVEQTSSRSDRGVRLTALQPDARSSTEHLFVSNHIELKGAGSRPWASGTD